jgi:hypothetical protein
VASTKSAVKSVFPNKGLLAARRSPTNWRLLVWLVFANHFSCGGEVLNVMRFSGSASIPKAVAAVKIDDLPMSNKYQIRSAGETLPILIGNTA